MSELKDNDKNIKNSTENILQGIPFMEYGNPSAVCFIGSVMRLMDYLHDPIEADELFSLSGTALCFPWKNGLTCDEVSILPEIPQRTFAALGYESEYIYEPDISVQSRAYSKEFYISKIKHSIDCDHPVIGFGFTELNFTCLITGYYDSGEGLYLRSYWVPKGQESCDCEQYYHVDDWYDKCHGIIVIGDKTNKRLTGNQSYHHIKETAEIFKAKKTGIQYSQIIYNGSAAFDDMAQWLLDDSCWYEGCDMNYNDMFLKPAGLWLLDHYRSYLHSYLGRLSEQYPGLVNPEIRPAIENLGSYITGPNINIGNLSTLDSDITDFSQIINRSYREKIAGLVMKLKDLDREIFNRILS